MNLREVNPDVYINTDMISIIQDSGLKKTPTAVIMADGSVINVEDDPDTFARNLIGYRPASA